VPAYLGLGGIRAHIVGVMDDGCGQPEYPLLNGFEGVDWVGCLGIGVLIGDELGHGKSSDEKAVMAVLLPYCSMDLAWGP